MSLKKYLENVIHSQYSSDNLTPYYSHFYENFENQISSLYVFVETNSINKKTILTEGKWIKSDYKDWYYRTDQENSGTGSIYHVHIAREKHMNTQPQYSWDKLCKRHDAHKFKEPIPDYAKTLASNILGVKKKYLEAICINENTILFG